MNDRAEALRTAFDAAFAEPVREHATAHVDLLRVRLGGEPYAIALGDLSGLHVDLHVTPLPTPVPELLGVLARGAVLVPVYDLRLVLGVTPRDRPRWTALVGANEIAFAFDGFDGLARDVLPFQIIDLRAVAATVRARWAKET